MTLTGLIKGSFGSLAFIAMGLFMRWAEAPGLVIWLSIVFGTVGFAGVVYRFFNATADVVIHNADDGSRVVLRDGREYRVDVTDATFALTHKPSSEVCTMDWSEVTRVDILTIDSLPIAIVSFMLHRSAGDAIEVPWDAEGSGAFLNAMQKKLAGFDNGAVIQALSMLHGLTQVWQPAAAVTSPGCVSPRDVAAGTSGRAARADERAAERLTRRV